MQTVTSLDQAMREIGGVFERLGDAMQIAAWQIERAFLPRRSPRRIRLSLRIAFLRPVMEGRWLRNLGF